MLSPQNYRALMTIYPHQHLLSWQFETSLTFFCIPTILNKLHLIQSKKTNTPDVPLIVPVYVHALRYNL